MLYEVYIFMQWFFVYDAEQFYTEEDICNCPTPCRSTNLEAVTSQAGFPNDYKMQLIQQQLGITDEDFFR